MTNYIVNFIIYKEKTINRNHKSNGKIVEPKIKNTYMEHMEVQQGIRKKTGNNIRKYNVNLLWNNVERNGNIIVLKSKLAIVLSLILVLKRG